MILNVNDFLILTSNIFYKKLLCGKNIKSFLILKKNVIFAADKSSTRIDMNQFLSD